MQGWEVNADGEGEDSVEKVLFRCLASLWIGVVSSFLRLQDHGKIILIYRPNKSREIRH